MANTITYEGDTVVVTEEAPIATVEVEATPQIATVTATTLGPQGPSGEGFDWKGEWSGLTQYQENDTVRYSDALYRADSASLNEQPDLTPLVWGQLLYIDPALTSEATTARDEAVTAKTAAETARNAAQLAEGNASTHATNASTSASNAATSEGNAATSAANAATSETNAAASKTAAATSETNAATSEVNALASKNKAQKWAEELENVEVEAGKYSSKHHALKSEYWAGVAEGAGPLPSQTGHGGQFLKTDGAANDWAAVAISDVTSLQTSLDGKSATAHLHDDRYYTEAEVDNQMAGKSDTTHTHTDLHSHSNKAVLDGTQQSFTSTLKTKLDGIAENANAYTHPSTHDREMLRYSITDQGANFTAAAFNVYRATAGGITITLPASPSAGNWVEFIAGADFATSNVTIARNGSNIAGLAENLIWDQRRGFKLVYSGTSWEVE